MCPERIRPQARSALGHLRPLLGLALCLLPALATAQAKESPTATTAAAEQEAQTGQQTPPEEPAPLPESPLGNTVDKASMSAGIVGTQTDYGVSVSVTSPYLWARRVALRAGAEYQLLDAVPKDEAKEVRHTYTVFRAGTVGLIGVVESRVSVYWETGLLYLMPESKLASDSSIGAYANLGMELFPRVPSWRPQYSVFFDVGLRGAPDAVAEKVKGEPFYGNGFTGRAGLRLYY
jgi:hypothetical protein